MLPKLKRQTRAFNFILSYRSNFVTCYYIYHNSGCCQHISSSRPDHKPALFSQKNLVRLLSFSVENLGSRFRKTAKARFHDSKIQEPLLLLHTNVEYTQETSSNLIKVEQMPQFLKFHHFSAMFVESSQQHVKFFIY